MAIGSGLGGQLGMIQEVTPGTVLSPTKFYEFTSESLVLKKTILQGVGIRPGGQFNRSSRRAYTQRDINGGIVMDLPTKGAGFLLQQCLGSFNTGATPVQQGASAAYLQTHLPGSLAGKAFSVQKGVPDITGTVTPLNYPGCKVIDWTIDCKVGGIVTLNLNLDAVDEVPTTPALASPSYIANSGVFNFSQGTLTQGGTVSTTANVTSVSGGTTAASVSGVSVKGKNAFDVARFFYGSNGRKAEQIENGYRDITGQVDAEFVSMAAFYTAMAADTDLALELKFVGPLIASTYYYTLDIILPAVRLESGSPVIAGPAILKQALPFTALDAQVGTTTTAQPVIQISYTSTDTAI
jgi:hypothetical protein